MAVLVYLAKIARGAPLNKVTAHDGDTVFSAGQFFGFLYVPGMSLVERIVFRYNADDVSIFIFRHKLRPFFAVFHSIMQLFHKKCKLFRDST